LGDSGAARGKTPHMLTSLGPPLRFVLWCRSPSPSAAAITVLHCSIWIGKLMWAWAKDDLRLEPGVHSFTYTFSHTSTFARVRTPGRSASGKTKNCLNGGIVCPENEHCYASFSSTRATNGMEFLNVSLRFHDSRCGAGPHWHKIRVFDIPQYRGLKPGENCLFRVRL